MKFQTTIFVLSLVGILSLIFVVQATPRIETGTIKSIRVSNTKTTIQLKNYSAELVIFGTDHLNLKKGEAIKFTGGQKVYKGKEELIVNNIFLVNNIKNQ